MVKKDKYSIRDIIIVVCCVIQLIQITETKETTYCTKPGCSGSNCQKIPCEHGQCNEQGICVCDGCWSGTSCSKQENNNIPVFVSTELKINVGLDHPLELPVAEVKAKDDDITSCKSHSRCPCAEINYSILPGNDYFRIDGKTGEIFATESLEIIRGKTNGVDLIIGADNEGNGGYGNTGSEVIVHISLIQEDNHGYGGFKVNYGDNDFSEAIPVGYNAEDELHHRSKRDLSVVPAGVTNVTFHFSKTGLSENMTTMMVGSKVELELAVQYPPGTTDMLVELFTPDNDTTVMVICDVKVSSVGSGLSINQNGQTMTKDSLNAGVKLEAKTTDSFDYDRAIISIGNVTNTYSGGGSAYGTEMIVITWIVYMIENSQTQNNSVYWVSAGAEYLDETEIWVGQASFTTITGNETSEVPSFNMSGPEQVQIGAPVDFRVDMYIPNPSVSLTFDAFAPLNTTSVMSVCSLLIVQTGEHYSCLQKERYQATLYPASAGKGNERARLDLATVTNVGIREDDFSTNMNLSLISIVFTMLVYNDSSNIGQSYSVGAAVEIGQDKIWAGQMSVQVVENVTLSSSTPSPTFTMSPSVTNASVYDTVTYDLNMTVPSNSEGVYEFEVLAPYNDSATRMKICNVLLISQGVNVPCFSDSKPSFSSRDSSNISDRVVWTLGVIRNAGNRDLAVDPWAGTVTFKIIAQVLNHSLNVDGELLWLTAGMTINNAKLWVGRNAVEVISETSSNTPPQPTFEMDYGFGGDLLEVGGATQVNFDIITKAGAKYYPMNLEFIMPFENNSAALKICRAEIVSNGQNLPCFDRATLNNSFVYSSKNSSEIYDKTVLGMGAVCNIKETEDNQTTEDKIRFSVAVQLLTQVNLVNGTTNWFSAGLSYSTINIWVGQLRMYTNALTKASYSSGEAPYFSINRTDTADPNDNVLYRGQSAVHLLTMKMPNQSRSDFTITVRVAADLSICIMRIKEIGRNFPCRDNKLEGNYTVHSGTYYNQEVVFAMGPVSNVGDDPLTQDDEFDNNTITIEIVTTSYGTAVTGLRNLDISIDYTSATHNLPTIQLDITAPNVITTTNSSMPTFSLSMMAIDGNTSAPNTIAKGESRLMNMDIYPAVGSMNKLEVKFLTPVNQTGVMEVCNAYVVMVGKNIPCMKKEAIIPTYQSRNVPDNTYTDIGIVNLGYVCQFQIDETDPDANKIQVQAVAKVTRENSLSIGDTVIFSATVNINDDRVHVTQMTLSITADFNATMGNLTDLTNGNLSRITVNLSDTAIPMGPGKKYDIPLVLNIPANISVAAYMDVKTPVNESAVMTISSIGVTSAGKNLGCIASNPDTELTTTYNSTLGTTQNDYVVLNFGYMVNSGITYRTGIFEEEDNLLHVTVQVQMADAEVNTQSSEHWLSIGFSLGDTIFVVYKKVEVVRTNTEEPDLLLTATLNNSLIYVAGDLISIEAVLKHTNMSTAEAYNVSATFYFPEFLSFVALTYINLTEEEVTDNIQGHGLQIKFARLYFTDIVAFNFTLKINDSQALPFVSSQLNGTTPFGASGYRLYRPGHINASDTWYLSRLDSLSYELTGPGSVGCTSAPLGMADGNIQDCQIEGSQSPFADKQPVDGRMGGSSAWVVGTRAGEFIRYMQVNFGNVTKVTEVAVKHVSGLTYSRVNQLKFWYSGDGIEWTPGETITATPSYSTVTLPLISPQEARYIRMEIVDDQNVNVMPSLQAEFKGCSTTSDKTPNQVCEEMKTSWDTYSPSPDLYTRGFLSTTTYNYFCDANPLKGNKVECFSSNSGSNTWDSMGETVVTVMGLDTATDVLYGIAWDKRSFIISEDNGETWLSIPHEKVVEAKAESTWVNAIKVPYIKTAQFDASSTVTTYNYVPTNTEARYGGIWSSSNQVTNWGTCC